MKRLHADFERTFKALEDGLQVEHIAEFDLKTCRPADPVGMVWADPNIASYDQLPVRNSRGIVGVLERQNGATSSPEKALVEQAMVPLDSAMLASNSQPVASLLDTIQTTRYRLVVKGGDIEGIVTPSDLLKLPVRLYAFMLVTHLEMLMAAVIRSRYRNEPIEAWMSQLSNGRQCRVREKIQSFSRQKLDPDPIELTDFCDKREILKHFHESAGRFVRDMEDVERLRNSLAHASNYLGNEGELDQFLHRVRVTRQSIDYLRTRMRPHDF
jgi:predicted transcriptional regulator